MYLYTWMAGNFSRYVDSGTKCPLLICWYGISVNKSNSLYSFCSSMLFLLPYDDVINWKHFPRNWPFVRRINWSPVNSPPKGQWRGALMFSLICAWTNGWVNNRDTSYLRRHRANHVAIVMAEKVQRVATWNLIIQENCKAIRDCLHQGI